jgi:tetratricopeptide (TPR) repeat protein
VSNRTFAIGLLVLLVAASIGVFAYDMGLRHSTNPAAAAPPARVSDALNAELDRIRVAEKIEDPFERCMAYPNPPEFNWSHALVEAQCRRLSRHMLGWKEIQDALDQGHPARIDQAFDGYFAKNFDEPGQHGFLTWTFWWMFQSSSTWADDATNAWVRSDPQSAYALAARGIHYTESAYAARGDRLYASTPETNVVRMREFAGRARTDLVESLKRNPRLIAAYHGLLRITRLGEDDGRDEWIRQALALDPADAWIYQDWLDNVDPKWGGSYAEMERVAAQAALHADANPSLALFKATPLCIKADEYRCESCDKDGEKSLALYREAGAIGPAGCFLDGAGAAAVLAQDLPTAVRYYSQAYRFLGTDEWLAYRAQNLRSLGRGDWALENLTDALARNPDNTTLLHALSLSYADAGRVGDVEKTYRRMLDIDPKNKIAAIDLGALYIDQLKTPEKARPLVEGLLQLDPAFAPAWFAKARLCEVDDDKPCYRAAAAKFLRYVNHQDPWQSANVSIVQARLREIGAAAE